MDRERHRCADRSMSISVECVNGDMWLVRLSKTKWAMWDLFEYPDKEDFFGDWTPSERKLAIKMVDEMERDEDG